MTAERIEELVLLLLGTAPIWLLVVYELSRN